MSPEELGEQMTGEELEQWFIFDQVIPLDHEAKMLASIASMIANHLGFNVPDDFFHPWGIQEQ